MSIYFSLPIHEDIRYHLVSMFPVPRRADWYIQDSRLGYSQRFAACEKDSILVAYGQTFTNTHAGHTPSALDKQSLARMEGHHFRTEVRPAGAQRQQLVADRPWPGQSLHHGAT